MNLMDSLGSLFDKQIEYSETLGEVNSQYSSSSLPAAKEVSTFLASLPPSDTTKIIIYDQASYDFSINSSSEFDSKEYDEFVQSSQESSPFKVTINIIKNLRSNSCNIYSGSSFLNHFSSLCTSKILTTLSSLYKDPDKPLNFVVLDSSINLHTKYIFFSSSLCDVSLDPYSRKLDLKKCEDSSSFLGFYLLKLLPQDFRVLHSSESIESKRLEKIFQKCETLLSYSLIASTSYPTSSEFKKIILQIEPGKMFNIDVDALSYNEHICNIYDWAYSSDNPIERVSIVRTVLGKSCFSLSELINIDSNLFSCIKSNFNIYQKGTVDKYVELKNQINEYILNSSVQLQNLIHELMDGFRNSFFAVFTFVVTTLLTNSLSSSDVIVNGFPSSLILASKIFIVATIAYFLILIISSLFKLNWINESYKQIRKNYEDILDPSDLNKTFDQNQLIKNSRKKAIGCGVLISLVWIAFIICLSIIVCHFENSLCINWYYELPSYIYAFFSSPSI